MSGKPRGSDMSSYISSPVPPKPPIVTNTTGTSPPPKPPAPPPKPMTVRQSFDKPKPDTIQVNGQDREVVGRYFMPQAPVPPPPPPIPTHPPPIPYGISAARPNVIAVQPNKRVTVLPSHSYYKHYKDHGRYDYYKYERS